MTFENQKTANAITKQLLEGVQLDSIQISSTVLNINFMRLPKHKSLPISVWISTTSNAVFSKNEEILPSKYENFFERRALTIKSLYQSIGEYITHADVLPGGQLKLKIGTQFLSIIHDFENEEEIWSITSDNPDPFGNQDWKVSMHTHNKAFVSQPLNS